MKRSVKQYRIQPHQDIENGKPVKRYWIIASNGKVVAKCNTAIFAQFSAEAFEEKTAKNNRRLVGGMRV